MALEKGLRQASGQIVVADDPLAADVACVRLMGSDPGRIAHIRAGIRFLGDASPALIEQVEETVTTPATPFQVRPGFLHLYTRWNTLNRRHRR